MDLDIKDTSSIILSSNTNTNTIQLNNAIRVVNSKFICTNLILKFLTTNSKFIAENSDIFINSLSDMKYNNDSPITVLYTNLFIFNECQVTILTKSINYNNINSLSKLVTDEKENKLNNATYNLYEDDRYKNRYNFINHMHTNQNIINRIANNNKIPIGTRILFPISFYKYQYDPSTSSSYDIYSLFSWPDGWGLVKTDNTIDSDNYLIKLSYLRYINKSYIYSLLVNNMVIKFPDINMNDFLKNDYFRISIPRRIWF